MRVYEIARGREQKASEIKEPLARHADHSVRAAATDGIGDPRRPKTNGASSPNRASIALQAAASFAEITAIALTVLSTSLLTPRNVWSRKTLAKQSAADAKASPCAVSSPARLYRRHKTVIPQTSRGSLRKGHAGNEAE
jgi:hypothetical protein